MAKTSGKTVSNKHTNKTFLIGVARAFAGAILFAFPMIMTMEMWSLGFAVERYRLIIFMTMAIPLLIGMSHYIGFEDTSCFTDDLIDAFVAYAVGFITSGAMLFLFGIFDFSMSADEIIGMISIQAVVAAIGALLAQSELGNNSRQDSEDEKKRRNAKYGGEMFLMVVGAVFLGMNPAPTEEIILISFKMTDLQVVFLALFIIILMHAFVYKVEFRGQEKRRPKESSALSVFFRYTVVGYSLVLIISLYLVWTFGHIDGLDAENTVKTVIVMSFPAALGASASRLIL